MLICAHAKSSRFFFYTLVFTCFISILFFSTSTVVYAQSSEYRTNSIGDVLKDSAQPAPDGSGGGGSGGDGSGSGGGGGSDPLADGSVILDTIEENSDDPESVIEALEEVLEGLPESLQDTLVSELAGVSSGSGCGGDTMALIALFDTMGLILEDVFGGSGAEEDYFGFANNIIQWLFANLDDPCSMSAEDLTDEATSLISGSGIMDNFNDLMNVVYGGSSGESSAPLDPIDGTVTIQESDCSSNWKSQTLPKEMENPELLYHIKRAAVELNMDPNQLAGVIWLESRGDPTAKNTGGCPKFSAAGLIQFVRKTAVGLGMHNHSSCSSHQATVTSMSISEQIDYTIKYYKGAGWKGGMGDYEAYAAVHAGNVNNNLTDSLTGASTRSTFNDKVLNKIEYFRCGGFDWNNLEFVEGGGVK